MPPCDCRRVGRHRCADHFGREHDELIELIEQITATEQAHPEWTASDGLLTQVAGGASAGGDVQHPTPTLSLDKVTEDKPGEGYEALAALIASVGGPVVVEPKLDGMAIRAVYRNGRLAQGITRGDGQSGEDVTAQARSISGLPESIGAGVDMEYGWAKGRRGPRRSLYPRRPVPGRQPQLGRGRQAAVRQLPQRRRRLAAQ